jgi:hypothetical protein
MIDCRIRRGATPRKTKWQRPPEPRNHVWLLPPGFSHAECIQEIARRHHWSVEPLPEQLTRKLPNGDTTYISARKLSEDTVYVDPRQILNHIVAHYQDMCWAEKNGVLRIEIRGARIDLSPFDERAGRLIADAVQRCAPKSWIVECENIGAELDKSFPLLENLEPCYREQLGTWMKMNSLRREKWVTTFSQALRNRKMEMTSPRTGEKIVVQPRRAVLHRFNRAVERWRKAHPERAAGGSNERIGRSHPA